MKEIYDWVAWYRELCRNIAENGSEYLSTRARQVAWNRDAKPPSLLNYGDENIDPFSFVYTVASYTGNINPRQRVYSSVTKTFELKTQISFAEDDAFILPTPQFQARLFHQDGNSDKKLFWRFFRNAVNGIEDIRPEDFKAMQQTRFVKAAKLTEALFLINATDFLPYDPHTLSLLNRKTTPGESVSWGKYLSILDECRKIFRGCAFYEINYLGYKTNTKNDTLRLNAHKLWQVSSRAFGDSNPDEWEDFQSNNHVYTGGPGNGKSWDEFDEEKTGVNYPIRDAGRGDILLVRSAGKGLGIGAITKNDYVQSPGREAKIHVVWLSKKETELPGEFNRSFGFSAAHKIGAYFRQAYPEMFDFLDGLSNGTPPPSVLKDQPLNTILYGPPGTGKTYQTFARCVEICDGVRVAESQIRSRYASLVEARRIEFVTFHQSYGYEEFVEGIRPGETDGSVTYEVKPGILKQLADRARKRSTFEDLWSDLLDLAHRRPQLHTKDNSGTYRLEHRDENHVELKGVNNSNDGSFSKSVIKRVWDKFWPRDPDTVRPKDIDNETGAQGTRRWIVYNELWKIASDLKPVEEFNNAPPPNYVLVIDEINRANISKVLGELITLLEGDKREGSENEIELRLPYSGDRFTLPPNLHILGTMNTADRSIALIDTALRRRFKFEEVAPDPDLLTDAQAKTKIDLPMVLKTINSRLEYLVDRDHLIGHAWFMNATSREDVDAIMRHKIIPLLAEYFYDDWKKVRAVLGKGFIKKDKLETPPGLGDEFIEKRFHWTVRDTFNESAYEALVRNAGNSPSSE